MEYEPGIGHKYTSQFKPEYIYELYLLPIYWISLWNFNICISGQVDQWFFSVSHDSGGFQEAPNSKKLCLNLEEL